MNTNALRDLMEFANKNRMFGQGWSSPQSSYDPSGARAKWAAEMAMRQQEQPANFFAADDSMEAPPMAYVRPQPRPMREAVNGDMIGGPREQRGGFQNFFRALFDRQPFGPGARSERMGGIRG